jgi:hypothetical protein
MNPYLLALLAVLAALVTCAAVLGALLLFHTRGRVARWWRFHRGESRNRRKVSLADTLRRMK